MTLVAMAFSSVSALLDDFGVHGDARRPYQSERRSKPLMLQGPNGRGAWLRDQKPLALPKLARLLDGGMTCEDWLRTLNGRVYLWSRPQRLEGFLDATPPFRKIS